MIDNLKDCMVALLVEALR